MVREKASSPPLIRQHDQWLDNHWLERIAGRLQQEITPLVAIEALDQKPWAWAGHGLPSIGRHQSESLLGDITGAAHLFGGEAGLLKATKKLLATLGLRGRMAIADSVGAAWALSHYAERSHAERSGVETDFFIATPETFPEQLGSLPVESLRISAATAGTLSRLGITRVDQLLRLPRSGLATRLGRGLVYRIEQALGQLDEPLGIYRAPAEHRATLAMEYPTSDQAILADRIGRLTKKIRAGLATHQRGALRMVCRLDLSAHPPLTLKIGLFAPTMDADHLSGLMINQLETKKLPSCVTRLTVSVTLSGPLRSAQASLFDDGLCDSNARADGVSGSAVSRLVDSLSGRLGRDAVVGVKIEDDPLPEKAFSVLPLAGNSVVSSTTFRSHQTARSSLAIAPPATNIQRSNMQRSRREPSADWLTKDSFSYQPSPDDAMRRPLSLVAEPIPLAVAGRDGPFRWDVSSPRLPGRIRLDGVIHLVAAHWGPERIETGWWKGPSIRRDYYRIETDGGRWWWIFRNLVSKTQASDTNSRYRWMLHGRFT